MWAQVNWKLDDLGLWPEPETGAAVTLTGPLGQPNERAVVLTHERGGSYGDVEGLLSVEPQQRYRLDVVYPTGEAYTAETAVPQAAEVELPTEVPLALQLVRGEVGYYEKNAAGPFRYPCEQVEGADLSVYKSASDRWIDALGFDIRRAGSSNTRIAAPTTCVARASTSSTRTARTIPRVSVASIGRASPA